MNCKQHSASHKHYWSQIKMRECCKHDKRSYLFSVMHHFISFSELGSSGGWTMRWERRMVLWRPRWCGRRTSWCPRSTAGYTRVTASLSPTPRWSAAGRCRQSARRSGLRVSPSLYLFIWLIYTYKITMRQAGYDKEMLKKKPPLDLRLLLSPHIGHFHFKSFEYLVCEYRHLCSMSLMAEQRSRLSRFLSICIL